MTFPGWKRPGLIEAESGGPVNSDGGYYFRGGNAPASLKHAYFDAFFCLPILFPGWKRPGLIEAPST